MDASDWTTAMSRVSDKLWVPNIGRAVGPADWTRFYISHGFWSRRLDGIGKCSESLILDGSLADFKQAVYRRERLRVGPAF